MAARKALGSNWRNSFQAFSARKFPSVTQPATGSMSGLRPSKDRAEARKRVLHFYAQSLRMAPRVYKFYEIDAGYDRKMINKRVRDMFEMYRDVDDVQTIDFIRMQGEQKFFEAHNGFFTKSHAFELLADRKPKTKAIAGQTQFLSDFYNSNQLK